MKNKKGITVIATIESGRFCVNESGLIMDMVAIPKAIIAYFATRNKIEIPPRIKPSNATKTPIPDIAFKGTLIKVATIEAIPNILPMVSLFIAGIRLPAWGRGRKCILSVTHVGHYSPCQ